MEYIINDCTDPYFNLALEEYLFNFNKDDKKIYFWLWQNDNTIVIGKNQNAFSEINAGFVKEKNIKVARRITGGGAVYHDLGNLNFSFIAPYSGGKKYDFRRFTDQIAKALETFGINAEYSGRNDLLLDGKKFSGNAQFVGEHKILHHGTILFSSDTDMINQCLNPTGEKLKIHGVDSVKSRITTISEHLSVRSVRMELKDFKNEIARKICGNYGGANIRRLTEHEIKAVKDLSDKKFSAYEWIYGESPEFNYSKSMRFKDCGTVNISMFISNPGGTGGVIENCRITGDFFGSGDVSELERLFNSNVYGRDFISDVIKSKPADLDYYFGRLDIADFLLLFD